MSGGSAKFPQTGCVAWYPSPRVKTCYSCDNWRGVVLLDVVGLVVVRVLQKRLHELPESQSGFNGGRSCIDYDFHHY